MNHSATTRGELIEDWFEQATSRLPKADVDRKADTYGWALVAIEHLLRA